MVFDHRTLSAQDEALRSTDTWMLACFLVFVFRNKLCAKAQGGREKKEGEYWDSNREEVSNLCVLLV